jgi:hypothetical protein
MFLKKSSVHIKCLRPHISFSKKDMFIADPSGNQDDVLRDWFDDQGELCSCRALIFTGYAVPSSEV